MKKAVVLILALFIALALVGCNVAPNVPGVTPYTTARVSPYPTTRVPNTNPRVSPYTTAPGNVPGYDTDNTYRYGYNGYDYNTTATYPVTSPNYKNATDKNVLRGGQ